MQFTPEFAPRVIHVHNPESADQKARQIDKKLEDLAKAMAGVRGLQKKRRVPGKFDEVARILDQVAEILENLDGYWNPLDRSNYRVNFYKDDGFMLPASALAGGIEKGGLYVCASGIERTTFAVLDMVTNDAQQTIAARIEVMEVSTGERFAFGPTITKA